MAKKTKVIREYINRQPQPYDSIVIVHESIIAGLPVGTEMIIASIESLTGNSVRAYNCRTGKVEYVHDDWYRIYTDVKYEKVGEDVIEKKFLGITYKREVIEKWREVGEC